MQASFKFRMEGFTDSIQGGGLAPRHMAHLKIRRHVALRDLTGAGCAQALLLRLALSQHQQFQVSVYLLNLAVLCRALRAQVEPYISHRDPTSSIRYLPIARGQRLDDMFTSSRMACCSRPLRSRCRGSLLRQNNIMQSYIQCARQRSFR